MPHKDLQARNACRARNHAKDPDRPAKMKGYALRFYRQRAKLIQEFKSRPCEDCKQSFPPCCMDFHHRNPTDKKFAIGDWGSKHSLEEVVAEIAKCAVICANCHRIRTFLHKRDDA